MQAHEVDVLAGRDRARTSRQAPFNQVISSSVPCKPSQSSCSWELANWGGGWIYGVDHVPTRGPDLRTGAAATSAATATPRTTSIIAETDARGGDRPTRTRTTWRRSCRRSSCRRPTTQLNEIQTKLHGRDPAGADVQHHARRTGTSPG